MSAERYLLDFVERHGVKVISDGDWDGILASAILVKWLKEKGFKCDFDSVEFPKPRDLVEMKIGGAILIELPPSRGYTVVEESLLFDHHTETGLFLVTEGGRLKALVKIEPFPSVARLVSVLLDINLPDMPGPEACKIIKANPQYSGTSIILMSASLEENAQCCRLNRPRRKLKRRLCLDSAQSLLSEHRQ